MNSNNHIKKLLLTMGCALAASSPMFAQHEDHKPVGKDDKAKAEVEKSDFAGDVYLLDTDPVTGEKLGPVAQQVIYQHEGRELRFTNEKNKKAFVAEPAKYLPNLDKAMIAQQLPFYPLKTCVVSGKELGSMGEPRQIVYRNRLVLLCCEKCEPKFLENSGKYIADLDAAVVAAQMPKYPLETCLVSGDEFGGEMGDPVPFVAGNRLIKMCCDGCAKKIRKDPLLYYGKLDKAIAGKVEKPAAGGHGHEPGKEHG